MNSEQQEGRTGGTGPGTALLITERVVALRAITPAVGAHKAPPNGGDACPIGCEMELLSWAAGWPWSDHMACVSPVVGAFLRRYKDGLDEPARRTLHRRIFGTNGDRGLAPLILATGSDGHEQERGYMLADWATRVALPVWLDLAGATDAAVERVRGLAPIVDRALVAHVPRHRLADPRRDVAAAHRGGRAPIRAQIKDAVTTALKEKGAADAVADAVAVADTVAAADAARCRR